MSLNVTNQATTGGCESELQKSSSSSFNSHTSNKTAVPELCALTQCVNGLKGHVAYYSGTNNNPSKNLSLRVAKSETIVMQTR